VLAIGEGNIPAIAKEGDSKPTLIKVPNDLLLMTENDKLSCIVNAIYGDLQVNRYNCAYLGERAILTPTNELADLVNDHVVSLLPGDTKEYLSADNIAKSTRPHEAYDLLYPVEFSNSLNGKNFPPHRLTLKKGVPVMLLRNLN
jgi:hypothetical protein